MNERIRELAKQADVIKYKTYLDPVYARFEENTQEVEKFAKLVIQECLENFIKIWYEEGMDSGGAKLINFINRFNEQLDAKNNN